MQQIKNLKLIFNDVFFTKLDSSYVLFFKVDSRKHKLKGGVAKMRASNIFTPSISGERVEKRKTNSLTCECDSRIYFHHEEERRKTSRNMTSLWHKCVLQMIQIIHTSQKRLIFIHKFNFDKFEFWRQKVDLPFSVDIS